MSASKKLDFQAKVTAIATVAQLFRPQPFFWTWKLLIRQTLEIYIPSCKMLPQSADRLKVGVGWIVFYKICNFKTQKARNWSVIIADVFEGKLFSLTHVKAWNQFVTKAWNVNVQKEQLFCFPTTTLLSVTLWIKTNMWTSLTMQPGLWL